MKIGRKLRIGFSLVVLVALLQGAVSVFQLDRVHRQAQTISKTHLPAIEMAGNIRALTSDIRIELLRHVMEPDAEKKRKIEDRLAKLDGDLDANLKAYAAQIQTEEETRTLEAFKAEWKKVGFVRTQALEFSRSGEAESAQAQLTKGAKAFQALAEALKNLEQVNQQAANTADDSINTTYRDSIASTSIMVVLMALLGGGIAYSLSSRIARGVEDAALIVTQVAEGNLRNDIPTSGADELGQMLKSLQAMQHNLARAVYAVRQGAQMVAHASVEIAQGNLDLSHRTEHQASALQEAGISMDALADTVRQNAVSAQKANDLALHASSIAHKGGDAVLKVVSTMKDIDASSRKISDIISVIDGIAFQTNILALNAAVEAARAGEHGRGFAVVASEVRTLAGRSADAAKEIKLLINDSVGQVGQGSSLVSQAGSTMNEVVEAIQSVAEIIGQINLASQSQADGVTQVGGSVSQIDEVTQQNAALVEQMSAATSSLKQQAGELVQAVAVFRLSEAQALPAAELL